MVGGIFWSGSGPVTTEIIGLRDLGSALSILWLSVVLPCTFAEPIAVWFVDYSQRHLHRTGGDAFLISIGFAGASFITASLVLLGAKRWKQKSWNVCMKTWYQPGDIVDGHRFTCLLIPPIIRKDVCESCQSDVGFKSCPWPYFFVLLGRMMMQFYLL